MDFGFPRGHKRLWIALSWFESMRGSQYSNWRGKENLLVL
jgi:hypothetical protein